MEGLSSFHTDILKLSCLIDNLKKNNNKSNIFCGTWRPPPDLNICFFLILYRSCPQTHSLRLIPAKNL